MGLTPSKPLPRSTSVPKGKTRLCVSGFGISHHTGRARAIVDHIVSLYPNEYESWYYFDSIGFRPDFLQSVKDTMSNEQQNGPLKDHNTSPFVWIEEGSSTNEDFRVIGIGGRDRLCEWVPKHFDLSLEQHKKLAKLCKNTSPKISEAIFDNSTPGTAKTS